MDKNLMDNEIVGIVKINFMRDGVVKPLFTGVLVHSSILKMFNKYKFKDHNLVAISIKTQAYQNFTFLRMIQQKR
jgi:hypothetical protein